MKRVANFYPNPRCYPLAMQPLTRLAFSLYGIVLAASKIALDWLLLAYFGLNWAWNFYYTPLPFNLLALTPGNRNLLLAPAALALPCTLAGVWLCGPTSSFIKSTSVCLNTSHSLQHSMLPCSG